MHSSDIALTPEKQRLLQALQQSLIFGDLAHNLQVELADIMQITAIAGGEALYQQGHDSDSLAIVISGRLSAQLQQNGKKIKLGEISSGRCVGELGLILHQPRGADVVALRDSTVATLNRTHFERILSENPIAFNRAITRRVYEFSQNNKDKSSGIGSTNFTVVPAANDVNVTAFSEMLHQCLTQHAKTHYFSAKAGLSFHNEQGASIRSSHQFSDLEQSNQYLLLETEHSVTPCPWNQLAIRQADHIVVVANSDTSAEQLQLDTHTQAAIARSEAIISVVVLHEVTQKQAKVDTNWHRHFDIERLYPIRLGLPSDIERLTRFLIGKAIGVVLGGGGARGLAHIGVLQALEESNIPIDMVCGNSMGALIGAQYANGTASKDLVESTTQFIKGGERPTLPFFSLLAGKRIKRGLQNLFGAVEIDSLWRPYFAVSCNLSHANIYTHDTGCLWQAVLASNSPAGILPPVLKNGEFLVDAALLDNVPVKAMRKKIGLGTLIAVDVDVLDELKIEQSIKSLSPWSVIYQYFVKRKRNKLPTIMDLLHRSGHLGGLAHRDASIAMADHYLQPPISNFGLMAYGKGQDIAQAGYHYTKQRIPEIKSSLER